MSENTPGVPRDPNEPDRYGESTPTDPYAPRPSEPDPEQPRPSDPEPVLPDPVRPEPYDPAPVRPEPVEPGPAEPVPGPIEPEPFNPPAEPTPYSAAAEPPGYGTGPSSGTPAYGSSSSGTGPSSGGPYGAPDPGTTPPGNYPAMPAYGGSGGSYGTPGGASTGGFGVGEALSFGWNRFKGNALAWILYVVILAVVGGAFNSGQISDYQEQMNAALEGRTLAQTGVAFGATALSILGAVISAVLQALAVRAALKEVSGEKPTLASFFSADRIGTVILAAVIVAILTTVGLFACVLPGLAIIVFATFTYHNVHDKGLGAWEAFTTSFRLVAQNFGPVFLLLLAALGLMILGSIPCGLGLFVVVPVVTIAIAYAFRRLTGGPVAAV
ncbi:hypothetical protein [Antribacter gilvus]|uniref:hypothetical protein n=1 Tax=Antribacter gilvus TaxID=2304675 RepID=UPI000F7AC4FC|nr:hypothetical protein [Antribacter gilvus]